MTWFWNPCLQEPETERHELFQENRFWEGGEGGGVKPFSWATFRWTWFYCWKHSGGQHFGFAKSAGRSEARNNCIYWAGQAPIYSDWQPSQGSAKKRPHGKFSLSFENIKVAFGLCGAQFF